MTSPITVVRMVQCLCCVDVTRVVRHTILSGLLITFQGKYFIKKPFMDANVTTGFYLTLKCKFFRQL
jgi:hypothetical protein